MARTWKVARAWQGTGKAAGGGGKKERKWKHRKPEGKKDGTDKGHSHSLSLAEDTDTPRDVATVTNTLRLILIFFL
jgi:hypothetical protein